MEWVQNVFCNEYADYNDCENAAEEVKAPPDVRDVRSASTPSNKNCTSSMGSCSTTNSGSNYNSQVTDGRIDIELFDI